MKNSMSKIMLAIVASGISACAMAANNESINVHFNGAVTQPTCTFKAPDKQVTLQTIKSSELENVNIGDASDMDSENFQLDLRCASKAQAEHISIMLNATADANNPNIIANTASENGTGLELFSEDGTLLNLNKEIPQTAYLDRLNEGDNDNVNFIVKYARASQNLSGGEVAGNAIFVVNYK